MSAQLRAKIYGVPLANFSIGYPTKCEAMRNYIWYLEEQYRLENTERLNIDSKRIVRDNFVKNLTNHWENQPNPKPLLDKEKVNEKVKPLIEFYWTLKNKKAKLDDQAWIDTQKEKLLPILDIEKKPVTKKRSIQEVRKCINQDSKSV